MSNIRYAVIIIGALSLLLGLSLGQIYHQHQRIEQLEFNRFRQSGNIIYCQPKNHRHDLDREIQLRKAQEALERAQLKLERKMRLRNEVNEERLQEAVRRYNKKLERWEDEWRSTDRGLIRIEHR